MHLQHLLPELSDQHDKRLASLQEILLRIKTGQGGDDGFHSRSFSAGSETVFSQPTCKLTSATPGLQLC